MEIASFHILIAVRTEYAKAVRRIYGDRGGHCQFKDRQWFPSKSSTSNAITSVQKDNMLLVEYSI